MGSTSIMMRLISAALVAAGLGVIAITNPSKSMRYKQILMPLIALAWIGAGLIGIHYLPTISAGIASLLFRMGLISVATIVSQQSAPFIFDFIYLLLFAFVKGMYNLISGWCEASISNTFRRQVTMFYEHDEDAGQWFLTKVSTGLRDLATRIAWIFAILAVIVAAVFAGQQTVHPAPIPLVIMELAYFLGGRTKKEYESSLTYEPGFAETVFGYSNLEKALRHYFGERLLVTTSRGRRHASAEGNTDLCERLLSSQDQDERICGAYFQALLARGLIGKGGDNDGLYDEFMHDRAIDTVRLLKGQSVLFATPFYSDLVPYVFLPVNTMLLRGGKVLILAGSEGTRSRIVDFVDEGISFVTNVPNMWEVACLEVDGSVMPDIAIMSFGDLDDVGLLVANEPFFQQVGMCLVVDPSSLLATYQIGLTMLAERLAKGTSPTYCAFDRNADGLVDSLSHALRVHLVEVAATDYSDGASFGLFWAVDGQQLQNRLMPGVARYLGMGTELELVALHEQVSKVTWAGRNAVPLLDMRWIVGQYYAEMFDFAELPQEQAEIDRHMEFIEEPISMQRANHRFLVVEDEHNNMFETYRQFSTRGIAESFVNVLTPNYLMRDYMAGNHRIFAGDPKAVPALAPDVSKAARNTVYSIVMTLLQTGGYIDEDELATRLRYAGVTFSDPGEALAGLMVEYFPVAGGDCPESHLVSDEYSAYNPATGHMSNKRRYRLTTSSEGAKPFAGLRNVPLITEMPDGSRKIVGTRVFDLIYQSWLPSQYLTLEGKYYEVVSISAEGVLLRRAADHFLSRHYYRQLRSYKLEIMAENARPDSGRTFQGIKVSVERAGIDVQTMGYLDMDDYGNIAGARHIEVTSAPSRRYENKELLRIVFTGASAEVTRTIAVVFSELLVTLFPKDHQYLAVLTSSGNDLPTGILNRLESSFAPNEIFLVEDSPIDIGLVSAVDRAMQRILETCFEFLDWHEETLNKKAFSAGIEVGEPPADAKDVDISERELKLDGIIARLIDLLRDRVEGKGGKDESTPPDQEPDEAPQSDPPAANPDGGEPAVDPEGPTGEPDAESGPQMDPAKPGTSETSGNTESVADAPTDDVVKGGM